MRAIKIDAHNRLVVEVDVNTLKDMQDTVGGYIESAYYFQDGSCLMVNEEGIINGIEVFFTVQGAHQPFAGNGLIVGKCDDEGETQPCLMDIEQVKLITKFYGITEIRFGIKECPWCHTAFMGLGALSRKDNKTEICDVCGTVEALDEYLINNKEGK